MFDDIILIDVECDREIYFWSLEDLKDKEMNRLFDMAFMSLIQQIFSNTIRVKTFMKEIKCRAHVETEHKEEVLKRTRYNTDRTENETSNNSSLP
jgi:hypothetical protein